MKYLDETANGYILQALCAYHRQRREHAKTLQACAQSGGNAMLTVEAARELAQEHTRVADDVSALVEQLSDRGFKVILLEY